MSTYDSLWCDYPLPEYPEYQNRLFQTKHLQPRPDMDYFRIRADGILVRLERDYVWNKDETQVLEHRFIERGRYPFTDACQFYTFAAAKPQENGDLEWVEYLALFDEGELVKLRLFKHRAPGEPFQVGPPSYQQRTGRRLWQVIVHRNYDVDECEEYVKGDMDIRINGDEPLAEGWVMSARVIEGDKEEEE